MLKVGLTGGIGSGKTTVSNHIKELGFPVYNSDSRAKWLMNNDSDIKNLVELEFGVSAYEKGVLNRKLISEIVFSDSSKLKKLNSVIHPAVAEDFKNWITQYDSNTIVFKEAAILIESKAYLEMDKIILVCCSEKIRLERVLKRDSSNYKSIQKRMFHQMTDVSKEKYADFIIDNSESEENLKKKVLITIEKLIELVKEK